MNDKYNSIENTMRSQPTEQIKTYKILMLECESNKYDKMYHNRVPGTCLLLSHKTCYYIWHIDTVKHLSKQFASRNIYFCPCWQGCKGKAATKTCHLYSNTSLMSVFDCQRFMKNKIVKIDISFQAKVTEWPLNSGLYDTRLYVTVLLWIFRCTQTHAQWQQMW